MKSGKTKPFRPHGANVITQHYRLDADDDNEDGHDQDLREAIMNSLNEVSGASPEEQTCVVSSLAAAGSNDTWRLSARDPREGFGGYGNLDEYGSARPLAWRKGEANPRGDQQDQRTDGEGRMGEAVRPQAVQDGRGECEEAAERRQASATAFTSSNPREPHDDQHGRVGQSDEEGSEAAHP